MPRTPYLRGVCGFSSILTLATVTRPAISVASSSRNGAIILQGPHHSAQKSTSTGSLARSTTASKLLSLTGVGFIAKSSVSSVLTLGEPQIHRQGGSGRVGGSRDMSPGDGSQGCLARVLLRPFRNFGVGGEPYPRSRLSEADQLLDDPDARAVADDMRVHRQLEEAALVIGRFELAPE